MASLDEIKEALDDFEIERTASDEEKLVELCTTYDLSADAIATKWDAFVYSRRASRQIHTVMDAESLGLFETSIKDSLAKAAALAKRKKKASLTHSTPSRNSRFTASTLSSSTPSSARKGANSFENIWGSTLESPSTPMHDNSSPSSSQGDIKAPLTPATPSSKKRKPEDDLFLTPSPVLRRRVEQDSPHVFASPAVGKYAARTKIGETAASFNGETLGTAADYPPLDAKTRRVDLSIPKSSKYRYMTLGFDEVCIISVSIYLSIYLSMFITYTYHSLYLTLPSCV